MWAGAAGLVLAAACGPAPPRSSVVVTAGGPAWVTRPPAAGEGGEGGAVVVAPVAVAACPPGAVVPPAPGPRWTVSPPAFEAVPLACTPAAGACALPQPSALDCDGRQENTRGNHASGHSRPF